MIRVRLTLLLLLGTACASPSNSREYPQPEGADGAVAAARAWRGKHGGSILREFAEFLRLPNVASNRDDIRENARWIVAAFRRRGVELEVVELPGAPAVVVGRLDAPGTDASLGLYVHFDGQPVAKDQWTFDPWTPTLCDRSLEEGGSEIPFPAAAERIDPEWRLYGRATGDDKAPILAILAALDALNRHDMSPSRDLVFLFEGEEEAGSSHLGAYMDKLGERLGADLWAILDGPVHQSRRPQLVFGVRGITGLDISVHGAARYLHSGHYGNWSPNAAHRLSRLLASMKDDDGQVLVQGFYDSVEPAGDDLSAALATIPPFEDALREELQLASTEADNAPYLERILLPSLNIRGMQSATVGKTSRNIVPPIATASIDIRLVKGNEPARMLDLVEAHIRAEGYEIVRGEPTREQRLRHPRIASVTRRAGYRAVRTSMSHPGVLELLGAVEQASDQPVVLMPTLGGSLPLYLFEDRLAAPVVIVPIANHDDNQHAPDENIRIANLWYGIDLMAALFSL